jgi:tetratricopeptide (TPR) repeat protein
MKTLLLFGSIISLSTTAIAQKIEKETFGDFTYTQTPSNLALSELESYFVEASVPSNDNYKVDEVRAASNLTGHEKIMNRQNATFVAKYTVYPTTFGTPEYDRQTNTRTNKDGTKTTTYTYTYKGHYTYKTAVMIYDMEGNTIHTEEIGSTKTINKSSNISADAANNLYKDEREKIRRSITTSTVSDLNKKLDNVVCTLQNTIQLRGIEIKEKKYEYTEFNAATDALKEACTEPNEVNLKAAIAAWEVELEESDPENRKARVDKNVTAGAHYNIALAYFVLGEYAKSEEAFNKATEFDKNVTIMHQVLAKTAADMEMRKQLQ